MACSKCGQIRKEVKTHAKEGKVVKTTQALINGMLVMVKIREPATLEEREN